MLVINGGSSSIKFAVFTKELAKSLSGKITRIGLPGSMLEIAGEASIPVNAATMETAAAFLMQWLTEKKALDNTAKVVHRIVHGMNHQQPELITPLLLEQLNSFIPFDPEHLPAELKLIEIMGNHFPSWKQVACFDTSFHASLPEEARLLPIPRKYFERGVRRYGFHGISYSYILDRLKEMDGASVKTDRIIIAHLGNGASMAAIKDGKSIDTTMGFTPAGGLVMSTRTGDLDPGVCAWIIREENLPVDEFNKLINHQSGLLGVSAISSDMQDLIEQKDSHPSAMQAIELFCYQAKKTIGALTAALGGLDYLVFTGGIGEHAPLVRSKICSGLEFLGMIIDDDRNERNELLIGANSSAVTIYTIPTDEEYQMAKMALEL